MDDKQIVDLYWERSEKAIDETEEKYGKYCYNIAYNILHNTQDSEECVNDTYMQAWNYIPPQRPHFLSSFLGKITRNLALNKYKYYTAQKRGLGKVNVVLEELAECLPAQTDTEKILEDKMVVDILNKFLEMQKPKTRKLFVRRYWYLDSIKEIANDYRISESNVKMTLLRTRNNLKDFMEKEGISI